MKLKVTTFALGFCLAIPCITATPAFARSSTGWGLFKVWMGKKGLFGPTYSCLQFNQGAVVNNCKFKVSLIFDLDTERIGVETVSVQDYFSGTNQQNTFSCTSYDIDGRGSVAQGSTINFTGPHQNLSSTVNQNSGDSIQLICYNIPPGGGVANINWAR